MDTISLGIANYLCSVWATYTNITYLYIDDYGDLVSWGGSVQQYGLLDLTPGLPVNEQVSFLQGFLPVSEIQILPFLSITEEQSANVHLVPFENGTYVLMFDAASEYEPQQKIQQQINDLKFMIYQQNQLIRALEQALQAEKRQHPLSDETLWHRFNEHQTSYSEHS